ncbi:NADH dehydrogenase [ubiquinone] 1 beta subcomplex subunit 3-like [Lagenorhynchus albirostris]|uniref:NADH dehydrogenase [ubiquinone] 1 beta subcomplex subunit 3-like n=1 Tax=Lagenorhynchus albirostris TaxID=27610 RepID=UPI0028E8DB6C|nr:NADH dehydrogenase [ubiquinone] 1 beta subcomplex subunit 3-like [Lagenorhynchus albirostris]
MRQVMASRYRGTGEWDPRGLHLGMTLLSLPSSPDERKQVTTTWPAHGHGHEHGHSKMELPDYKQQKIEGTPLETVQEKLAAQGLRDPWGRSEAWRYTGGFANNVSFVGVLLKGFKWGFAALVVAVGAEYYLESWQKEASLKIIPGSIF